MKKKLSSPYLFRQPLLSCVLCWLRMKNRRLFGRYIEFVFTTRGKYGLKEQGNQGTNVFLNHYQVFWGTKLSYDLGRTTREWAGWNNLCDIQNQTETNETRDKLPFRIKVKYFSIISSAWYLFVVFFSPFQIEKFQKRRKE